MSPRPPAPALASPARAAYPDPVPARSLLLLLALADACERPTASLPPTSEVPPIAAAPEVEHDLDLPAVASDDLCPDAAENLNGIDDDDGCPEELPPDLAAITGVIQDLRFAPDKDVIKDGRERLTAIAAVLSRYPAVLVEIHGHVPAPPRDRDYYRVDLSSRRADAIRRFLIHSGVDAARVIARGYGYEVPIADNKTPAGRARNSRVELVVVTRSP